MRCALVVPSWRPEDIFSSKTAGSQINYWQPLGTLYVAASLKAAGHDVTFVNGAFLSEAEVLDTVKEFAPDAVGLYSTAFGWERAKRTGADTLECCLHADCCGIAAARLGMRIKITV